MKKTSFILIFILSLIQAVSSQQIKINRIEKIPNMPQPYIMRDWKQVALGYNSIAFDIHRKGEYLPLTRLYTNTVNFPGRKSYRQHTFVGSIDTLKTESINTFMGIVGATLCGIDMRDFNGEDWVAMSEEFFNHKNGLNLYGNLVNSKTGHDWWYELIPNVLFYQLYSLYPQTGNFKEQFTTVADRWMECVFALGASVDPWRLPDTNYRAFNFSTMKPLEGSVPEPEAAGALGWLFYKAYNETKDEKYLNVAKLCMETFSGFTSNPSYELQYLYGTVTAAQMNAELGVDYDLDKMLNWCFNVGPLRRWAHTAGWGMVVGKWNGMDASGIMAAICETGDTTFGDFAFIMNSFQQGSILAPIARYDDRYARALGKYILNMANSARFFYARYLPEENQDCANWSRKYDPESYIAYEAVRQYKDGKSPYATGDALPFGWAKTNLSLYSSCSVGYLGSILEETNVEGILKIDLLKTDFFNKESYPTYLYFNPHDTDKIVKVDLGRESYSLYDAVSNKFIAKSASGNYNLRIPKDHVVVLVLAPKNGKITRQGNKTLSNGIVIDYK